ncbi:TIGR02301 family protein [Ponticaulis sp.]|uniref:TIGR02301 family protein n=1 Tax=Ponticaulis sp. TaxID=2020902 RepID=UPI00262345AE|nr:TIGR02301 family protein [Ponticaulis sp.]MDF1681365.1 TIGR02301 family protein [Ponticaulis sp.]
MISTSAHMLRYASVAVALSISAVGASNGQEFRTTRQYQSTLTDLSRVLGQIHAMRVVCNGTDDQTWREYMLNMLDVEAPSSGYLRSRLIDTFNRAYLDTQRDVSGCDASTTERETELFARGRTLSENLSLMAAGETP